METITELLVLKDLYICGRINLCICAVLADSDDPGVREYKRISQSYVSDSIAELRDRRKEIKTLMGPALDMVLNTTYKDFDSELFNDMMRDYFGDMDSCRFATTYGYYSDDFNSLVEEWKCLKT